MRFGCKELQNRNQRTFYNNCSRVKFEETKSPVAQKAYHSSMKASNNNNGGGGNVPHGENFTTFQGTIQAVKQA